MSEVIVCSCPSELTFQNFGETLSLEVREETMKRKTYIQESFGWVWKLEDNGKKTEGGKGKRIIMRE